MQTLFKALSISFLFSIALTPFAIAESNSEYDLGKFSPQECYIPELELPEDFVVYAAVNFPGADLNQTIDKISNQGGEVVRINVNSPSKPVVLIVVDHQPTIWKFSWTKNTEIIGVLATGYYRQAIAGLPKETPTKISTFDNGDECGYLNPIIRDAHREVPYNRTSLQAVSKTIFGQEIEKLYPSEEKIIGEAISKDEFKELKLLTSDDTPINSLYPSDSSKTGLAGIEEAVAKGYLRLATKEDYSNWLETHKKLQPEAKSDSYPPYEYIANDYAYVIVSEEFTYPPGMYGAQAGYFFIPQGLSKPKGKLGHSAVLDNNTGTCNGYSCQI